MEAPKSQITDILSRLITTRGVSEQQTNYNSFRTRISDLRIKYGLRIQVRQIEFTNRFGHDATYSEHYLLEEDKPAAVELYNRLNK